MIVFSYYALKFPTCFALALSMRQDNLSNQNQKAYVLKMQTNRKNISDLHHEGEITEADHIIPGSRPELIMEGQDLIDNGIINLDDFPSTFPEIDREPAITYILPTDTLLEGKGARHAGSGDEQHELNDEDIEHLRSALGGGTPAVRAVTRHAGNVTGRRKRKHRAKPLLSFDYATLDQTVADEIRQSSTKIRKVLKASVILVGRELTSIKGKLEHGEFGAWLDEEFGWTPRTAQNMMNAAALVDKYEQFSYLQPSVLYKLAAPSTPLSVVDRIAEELKRGRHPTLREIKRKIDKANGKSPVQVSKQGSNAGSGETARVGNHPSAANANQKAVAPGATTAPSRMGSAKAAEDAVALLKSRLGSEFDRLLTLVFDAGNEFGLAMRALRP